MGAKTFARIAVGVLTPLASGGCIDNVCMVLCPPQVGLDIGVFNDLTGEPLCDATVYLIEGSHEQPLDGGCRHYGAYAQPGTYSVRAEREGFVSKTVSNVRVVTHRDECCTILETVHLDIRLSPAQ
jgi:hypothetical protein